MVGWLWKRATRPSSGCQIPQHPSSLDIWVLNLQNYYLNWFLPISIPKLVLYLTRSSYHFFCRGRICFHSRSQQSFKTKFCQTFRIPSTCQVYRSRMDTWDARWICRSFSCGYYCLYLERYGRSMEVRMNQMKRRKKNRRRRNNVRRSKSKQEAREKLRKGNSTRKENLLTHLRYISKSACELSLASCACDSVEIPQSTHLGWARENLETWYTLPAGIRYAKEWIDKA